MAIVVDKLLGSPLLHSHVKLVTSDPASASNGDFIINTTTGLMKVWYGSGWWLITQIAIQNKILIESGDFSLLESGDNMLMEYNTPSSSNLQLEA